jgi:phosphatidylserine decarboxylase
MQVYVRLGIRLLYKGAKSRMEGNKGTHILLFFNAISDLKPGLLLPQLEVFSRACLSSKVSSMMRQSLRRTSLRSSTSITWTRPRFWIPWIRSKTLTNSFTGVSCPHRCYTPHLSYPPSKLKSDARPVENPDDPSRLVSGADCRLMAFESVNEATRVWIKGREFSVARLLGEAYADQTEKYNGGALCIFRLAPQDYHRFHSPVDGKIGKMTYISGEYYTVNVSSIQLVTLMLN